MWQWIKNILNFPLINWDSNDVFNEAGELVEPATDIFTFTIGNVFLVVLIYLAAKLFIKYIKRYFKAWNLNENN